MDTVRAPDNFFTPKSIHPLILKSKGIFVSRKNKRVSCKFLSITLETSNKHVNQMDRICTCFALCSLLKLIYFCKISNSVQGCWHNQYYACLISGISMPHTCITGSDSSFTKGSHLEMRIKGLVKMKKKQRLSVMAGVDTTRTNPRC
jgi:hypothetical protein